MNRAQRKAKVQRRAERKFIYRNFNLLGYSRGEIAAFQAGRKYGLWVPWGSGLIKALGCEKKQMKGGDME